MSCADAGGDFTAPDHDADGWAQATLDASASTAAAGQSIVQWTWSEGATVLATTPVASVALSTGVHELTLTIVDSLGRTGSDTVAVTVEVPPLSAIAGPDIQVAADAPDGTAVVMLDSSASVCRDGAITALEWLEGSRNLLTLFSVAPPMPYLFGVGVHHLTLKVYDSHGREATDTLTVTVTQPQATVPGDADGDGHVTIADFVILKQNYGLASGAGRAQGDFDGDGAVSISDFVILKQNYGR